MLTLDLKDGYENGIDHAREQRSRKDDDGLSYALLAEWERRQHRRGEVLAARAAA